MSLQKIYGDVFSGWYQNQDIKHTYHDDRTSESFWWGVLFNQSSGKLVFCSYAIIFFQCHNPDESMFQKTHINSWWQVFWRVQPVKRTMTRLVYSGFLLFYLSTFFAEFFPLGLFSQPFWLSILYFLLDPGKPGVRSMSPNFSETLLWDLTSVTLADEDSNSIGNINRAMLGNVSVIERNRVLDLTPGSVVPLEMY